MTVLEEALALPATTNLAGLEVTFVTGDPPRRGRFAFFSLAAPLDAADGSLELVLAAGKSVRRRQVPAKFLPMAEALPLLLNLEDSPFVTTSAECWARALSAGIGLIAHGRIRPAVSPNGFDAWRVGPKGPQDVVLLDELAAAMPPAGHAVAIVPATTPTRVHSPAWLIAASWDALADSLVRTPSVAPTGVELFATDEPRNVEHLRPWLQEATAGLDGGASMALRIHLEDDADDTGDELPGPRAVLQVSSMADPSLVVDAADLFVMPEALLGLFGKDAERDLLLALRRGAHAWPPIGELLTQQVPSVLPLNDNLLADLLIDGAAQLSGAGIEVLWPKSLIRDGLGLRAILTPAPAGGPAGFKLDQLLEFRYELTVGGEALSAEEIDLLAEAKRGLVRIRGRFVAVDAAMIAKAAERRAARRVSAAAALAALLGGKLDVDGEPVDIATEGELAELADLLRALATGALQDIEPSHALLATLRPYQRRGLAWLAGMTELGLGACLADDMGLGKTVQVIALHLHRAATTGRAGPTLVVCPTSLLGNWERELNRFAPSVPVRRFHGGDRHLDDLSPTEVVLTTYGILRRERESLAQGGFAMVVADEAQHAKNPLSETAKALRAVPAQARVALTGTPVENRLTELWSILDWTTPGLLGPLDRFRRNVAVAIERNHDAETTERLARTVRPFLLRRKKTDPAIAPDLPERTVTDLAVPLTTEQASLYEAEVREAMEAIRTRDGIARQGLVLRMLTVLKQICNHPAQYLHQDGPLPSRSGKLAALDELLDVITDAGDSVLVFSQFVEMCSLISRHLGDRHIPSLFLHGGVPARKREEMVAAFQAGSTPVFLLSLKAGGVGLNLTRATHVIHYDRWWNPAVEDQASDRAHRIGQTRAVQIHRLVCEGTLEDRIAELLAKKRHLADTILSAGEAWIGDLSDDELGDLVRLDTVGSHS